MAKDKKIVPLTPSRFGSHSSMIVESEISDENLVTLKDEFGEYVTEKSKLDTGLADPNRYAVSRISKLFVGHKKEKE